MANDYSENYDLEQVKNYVKSVNWDKRLDKEIPFLVALFNKYNYKNICDLGCGPGMHAFRLAKNHSSFQVTGLDIDNNMISYASQMSKLQKTDNLKFIQGNFLDQPDSLEPLKGTFDLIFTLGNALMIIWSTNDSLNLVDIFKKLAYYIKSKGGLFFQILNSDAPRNGHVISKISTNEANENQILVKHFIAVNDKLYTTFTTLKWKQKSQEVNIVDSRKGNLKLVSLEQLKKVLDESGFENFSFYENYDGDHLKPLTSDSLMCFAQKK